VPDPGKAFDASLYGLKSVHCRVLEGFIFLCFAPDPPSFDRLVDIYKPHLEMYKIADTKIAFSKTYRVASNWKLIGENARECYHCGVGHPEYCRVIPGSNLLYSMEPFERLRDKKLEEWAAKGIPTYGVNFEDANDWVYCLRYPYSEGFVTESLDGEQVAPLLGHRQDPDVGVFSIVQYPDFWLDVNPDHLTHFVLRPVSATETDVEMTWLVRKDAVEGKDYEVDKVIAVWRTTGEQDWRLCADNQLGVNSRYYQPGPHTPVEAGPEQFDSWYINELLKP
jgi:Rieske 2Fe-2S family protein